MTYTIRSEKTKTVELECDFEEAIKRAREIEAEYQPAFGVQIECEGETVWDSGPTY